MVKEKIHYIIGVTHQLDVEICQRRHELLTLFVKSLMTEFCGVLQNVFKLFVTEISENIISSMAWGVEKPIFKQPTYENNFDKKHVVEPYMVKNDVPYKVWRVEKPIPRESNHRNNMSMKAFHKPLMTKMEQFIKPKNDETCIEDFHKSLKAKMEQSIRPKND